MRKIIIFLLATIGPIALSAQINVDYEVGVTANLGDNELAPHYITANRNGTITQQYGTLIHAGAWHHMDTTRRVAWGAGASVWGGWTSSADYYHYNQKDNHQHPARLWLQEAYLEGKHRSVSLTLGAKQHLSPIVNDELSSGDMVWSANARPMPGIKMGFVNFQNIPLTNGWVQLNGEIGYYKPGDDKWLEHHYNYYNHFITTDWWMNYKYLHLRSNPHQPLVVTLGMQAACQFGGNNVFFERGTEVRRVNQKADAEAFFKAFIPGSGGSNIGDEFFEGNHLGTWDIHLDYRLARGHLAAYHQHLWEDGSGLGFRNGFDGLWGIEYKLNGQGILEGAAVEYLDLTNQSGPIHWAPSDHPDTPLIDATTGGDDYYNNYAFCGYHVRGMALGNALVASPLYNTDGYMRFIHNRVRALHVAACGHIGQRWSYRLMASRRAAWGSPLMPQPKSTCTSFMAEVGFTPISVQGLQCKATIATDHGSLLGDNVAGMIQLTYSGNLTLGKK